MRTLEVQPDALGAVEAGEHEVPLARLSDLVEAPFAVTLRGVEYTYARSVPVKGSGATLPPLLATWAAEGRDVLIGQRGMRYYVYLTPARTPSAPAKE